MALANGNNGCSCSEAIMTAFSKGYGLDRGMAMRLASGFWGGMGLMGETCGAITAAFMIIGLKFGTDDITDSYSRQNTYLMVAEFAERFEKMKGSIRCRELCVGHSMATPKAAKALRESGKPREMILAAAELLGEMLLPQT
jgi:C_GCAxxG_C_C family probable redox protein